MNKELYQVVNVNKVTRLESQVHVEVLILRKRPRFKMCIFDPGIGNVSGLRCVRSNLRTRSCPSSAPDLVAAGHFGRPNSGPHSQFPDSEI